jgi:hypothetical protein
MLEHQITLGWKKHAWDKLSSLLGLITSYEENAVLGKLFLGPYSRLINGHNKLELQITLGWKNMSGINALAYWSHLYVSKRISCEYDSWEGIHNTSFFCCEWAQ